MLTQADKLHVITEFRTHEQDSGSTEVQIALTSKRIEVLQAHLTQFKKDFSAKRGLLKLVSVRKTLLKYLQRTNEASYKAVIARLGIRK